MKIQRTKNAARNIVFDGLSRLVSVLIPFLMRSVMLRCLGVEYLGLNGMFRSLLAFLNLAELGVGSAMVFSMYKPIAEDDADTICALMRLYRRFYRAIGLFIAAVGLALTPFLRVLVKGEVPAGVDLCVLYFLNLGSTVLTYWLFAYKNSLLKAHQRGDVGSRIALAVRLAEFVLKLAALTRLHSYYLYLIIQLLAQIATNIITARRVDRLYPAYAPRGELPKEQVRDITRRVRDFFTAKFSHTISESADTLVISAFLGLTALAVYQNYFYILVSLRGFLEVIIGACIAGVGNSLVTESREKNYRDLRRFSLLFGWLTGVSTAMLLCLYQPFMRLWMGEEHMLTANYVICFAVYYYTVGKDHQHVQGRCRPLAPRPLPSPDGRAGQPHAEPCHGARARAVRRAAVHGGLHRARPDPLAAAQPLQRDLPAGASVGIHAGFLHARACRAGRLRGLVADLRAA